LVVSPSGDLAAYSSDEQRDNNAKYWVMKIQDGTHSQLNISDSKLFKVINVANQPRGEKK